MIINTTDLRASCRAMLINAKCGGTGTSTGEDFVFHDIVNNGKCFAIVKITDEYYFKYVIYKSRYFQTSNNLIASPGIYSCNEEYEITGTNMLGNPIYSYTSGHNEVCLYPGEYYWSFRILYRNSEPLYAVNDNGSYSCFYFYPSVSSYEILPEAYYSEKNPPALISEWVFYKTRIYDDFSVSYSGDYSIYYSRPNNATTLPYTWYLSNSSGEKASISTVITVPYTAYSLTREKRQNPQSEDPNSKVDDCTKPPIISGTTVGAETKTHSVSAIRPFLSLGNYQYEVFLDGNIESIINLEKDMIPKFVRSLENVWVKSFVVRDALDPSSTLKYQETII